MSTKLQSSGTYGEYMMFLKWKVEFGKSQFSEKQKCFEVV